MEFEDFCDGAAHAWQVLVLLTGTSAVFPNDLLPFTNRVGYSVTLDPSPER